MPTPHPAAPAVRRLPTPDEIRADLAQNLRERSILRDLLRLAQRAERIGAIEFRSADAGKGRENV